MIFLHRQNPRCIYSWKCFLAFIRMPRIPMQFMHPRERIDLSEIHPSRHLIYVPQLFSGYSKAVTGGLVMKRISPGRIPVLLIMPGDWTLKSDSILKDKGPTEAHFNDRIIHRNDVGISWRPKLRCKWMECNEFPGCPVCAAIHQFNQFQGSTPDHKCTGCCSHSIKRGFLSFEMMKNAPSGFIIPVYFTIGGWLFVHVDVLGFMHFGPWFLMMFFHFHQVCQI